MKSRLLSAFILSIPWLAAISSAVAAPPDRLYPQGLSAAAARNGVSPPVRAPRPARVAPLDEREREMLAFLTGKKEEMVALLQTIVEVNSGSHNAAGIQRCGKLLSDELERLGFATERVPETRVEEALADGTTVTRTAGPHRVCRHTGERGEKILLIGHVDTVFEPGTGFLKFTRADDVEYGPGLRGDVGYGPGVADMKGGLVVMLYALRALAHAGALDGRDVTVILNGDEELGSLWSRSIIERECAGRDRCLVFEPGDGERDKWGALTIARKGLGQFKITVHGTAAHAGGDHHHGVNAADDLCRKAALINRLTDYRRGLTLNVGIIDLGPFAKRNRVPAWAQMWVDLRFWRAEDGERAYGKVREIAERQLVYNPWLKEGTRSEFWGVLHRPPMPQDEARDRWYAEVAGLAKLIDVPVAAVGSGGGSDANLTTAAGVLSLDSLGPMGDAAHTTGERVYLDTFEGRAKLAALTIYRLWRGGASGSE
ncbi:MAG: M20 family metallopeptidase [Armatimonadota bacterium]